MKAAQYFGQRDIRITEVEPPEPQEHEALIAIEWCGICGSDLHEYLHGEHSKAIQTYVQLKATRPNVMSTERAPPSNNQRTYTCHYGP